MKVSIIMPSYNEESNINNSLLSIRKQQYIINNPDDVEIILVDSFSDDRTVEIANWYTDDVVFSPKGKLTARMMGTSHAIGDIIVSVDADCTYPSCWLNKLLSSFDDKSVVAVSGGTVDSSKLKPSGVALTVGNFIDLSIINRSRIVGRNSAYYKKIFYDSGGFDESINQLDGKELLEEEEIGFGKRMSKIGKVVFNPKAYCVHFGGKRIGCRNGLENASNCKDNLGTDRF